MRIIHFKDNRTSAKPLYIQSRILPIYEELKLRNCMLAYDILRSDSLLDLSLTFAHQQVKTTYTKQKHLKIKS